MSLMCSAESPVASDPSRYTPTSCGPSVPHASKQLRQHSVDVGVAGRMTHRCRPDLGHTQETSGMSSRPIPG